MRKMFHIAVREFVATVATKGFIFGVLVTPLLIGLVILLLPRLLTDKAPRVEGEVALLDPTGEIAPMVVTLLSPEAMAKRRAELAERVTEEIPEELRGLAGSALPEGGTGGALTQALGEVPRLSVTVLPAAADLEREKQPLKGSTADTGGRLALVAIHPDAVVKAPGKERYGRYDLFVRARLDDRIEGEIRAALKEAIVEARTRAAGLDRQALQAIVEVGRVRSATVTAEGESETSEIFAIMLPAGFMVLLLISVLISGQNLLTTTVEEKSSRVVEVLLSAVTPMQLLAGKVLGQMAAGFLILFLYTGLGVALLASFAMIGLLEWSLLLYLLLFYVISYATMASMMAAIGAAVSEMREAQTLMTPVMLVVMLPWILWMPISRNPNSTFSTLISFVPPVNIFAMLLRMTSSTPPPAWQVWLSIAIGAAGVYVALWAAAKIFRIGLLMFGKPPDFATLFRWIRMA